MVVQFEKEPKKSQPLSLVEALHLACRVSIDCWWFEKCALKKAVYVCHPERVRGSGATEGESKDPEDVSSAMLIQGVFLRDCPGNSISRPRCSARSFQGNCLLAPPALELLFASDRLRGVVIERAGGAGHDADPEFVNPQSRTRKMVARALSKRTPRCGMAGGDISGSFDSPSLVPRSGSLRMTA